MKIKIKKYKIEKVEIDSQEFELPTEPMYAFETNVRRSIRIIPKFTTWQKQNQGIDEELYCFEITLVYLSFECKIEKFTYNLNVFNDHKNIEENSFLNAWVNNWFDSRTKEMFDADLKTAIDKINE
jgi:hypothetical protein